MGCDMRHSPFFDGVIAEALRFSNGFVGASSFAGAAIDAFVGVDDIGSVTGGDGTYRANICAGAAGDTKVGIDDSRHSK